MGLRSGCVIVATMALAVKGQPRIGTCPLFPLTRWNTPGDQLPVDLNSDRYIATIGASAPAHPDLGSGLYEGQPMGIPFVTVPGGQKKVPTTFDYSDESDPGPIPHSSRRSD
jgi:hypothetical protein